MKTDCESQVLQLVELIRCFLAPEGSMSYRFFSLALLYSVLPCSRSHATVPFFVQVWCLSDSPVGCFNSLLRQKTDIFLIKPGFCYFTQRQSWKGPISTTDSRRHGTCWRQEDEGFIGRREQKLNFWGAVCITLPYLILRHLKIGSSNLNSLRNL